MITTFGPSGDGTGRSYTAAGQNVEGKVTGLAAFGNPEPLLPVMREMIAFKESELRARCGPLYRPSYDGFEDEVTHLFDRERPEDIAEFMPFAPATASEHAPNCYTNWQSDHVAAEFLTMTYNCEPSFWPASPAIVHVDGTARHRIPSCTSYSMHGLKQAGKWP